MINLPKITDLPVSGKKVLLRADLDVGDTLEEGDDSKLLTNKETINYLIGQKAKVILTSHRGRPEGKVDESLSLSEVADRLSELLSIKIGFVRSVIGEDVIAAVAGLGEGEVICLENLRFQAGEENNDPEFSKNLSALGDVYINEAFSSSAKAHASIVGIPKLLPHAFGFHFLEEINNLSRVLVDPKRPVVILISGVKEDKLSFVEPFSKFADKILIAGRLPDLLDRGISRINPDVTKDKIVIADLIADKEDITLHSIEKFESIINSAGTVVVGGPVGRYEDEGHRQGTKKVFEAVANSGAFKVAGGGDTEQAVGLFGLTDKFDWVSVGGGASLEFLAKGTLPGIEAQK